MSHNTVYCALCSRSRKQRVASPNLTLQNHGQIIIIAVFAAWSLYSAMGMAVFFLYPFIWMVMEFSKKSIYRKEVKCPHCGFDAICYVRDVRKAKALIKQHYADHASGYVDLN